jgi:sarcosine oxidase subunit alpha
MNVQAHRLTQGGQIDRTRPLNFSFDGRCLQGYAGDTLSSALLASGVRLVGRSFKYHRPRGILSAGPEEPNALVELRSGARREPNTRATQIEIYDGLEAESQNRWPSLAFDVLAVNSCFGPLLGAGFYYKTFMWPAAFWERVYEPLIRRAAGLGRASGLEDADRYEKTTHHCDLLVIGAGPAGLMAALVAARSGARVTICEQDFALGGRLLSENDIIDGAPAVAWIADVEAELASFADVTVLRRTTVVATYDHGNYAAVERVADHVPTPTYQPRQRLWRIYARASVLTAGAIERPLVFGDNDRPGVMLAGAVRTYVNRFAVLPGRRAVVFAPSDESARTIDDLSRAGVAIAAIVDPRTESSDVLRAAARRSGAPLYQGSVVRRAVGGKRGVVAAEIDTGSKIVRAECDLLTMSGGWNPAVHLSSHLGHRPVWNAEIRGFLAVNPPPGMRIAGAAAGHGELANCLADGAAAACATLDELGFVATRVVPPETAAESPSGAPLWRVRNASGKSFVDFQNDVTDKDVELAAREGFRRVEHMKRYTTLGMATDQGKTSNVNGLALMAEITGVPIETAGTTVFRPPYTPVAIAAFAGHARGLHFRPTRRAPTHEWSREKGAVFVEAGAWLRAQYYRQPGDRDWLDAANREAKNVRENVGFCDVSTLGKIDIQGADAGVFLDRLYCNMFSTLALGKVRYGVMLREDGIVLDDGTTARLSAQRWLMTTTTANAAKVLQHMEYYHQVVWPSLDVRFTSITDQWAQVSLAGPRAREVLANLVDPSLDVSNEGLPYMGTREGRLKFGATARIFRISFSGERAYEIAVPARWGDALMRALMECGRPHGIAPYGTEALTILRAEKGHFAGGELNGHTTARDLGVGRMMSVKKDFVGRALAGRTAFEEPERPILVGFAPLDRKAKLDGGAHFFDVGASSDMVHDLGYMTTATYSATLGHWIGLGLLANGRSRIGETLRAVDLVRGKDILVRVCEPCFVDPDGERLRG